MIVDTKHKFVYFDIPKTASSTLDQIFIKHGGKLVKPPSKLAKHNRIVPAYALEYKKIVSIRNPYDRATSHYFMAIRNKTNIPTKSFEDYLDYCISTLEESTNTTNSLMYHWFPMWKFLGDWLYKIDYIIRFEHLNEDLAKIPFIKISNIPHINEVPHKKFEEIKTSNIINKINTWAEKDFEIFGYKKY